MMKDMPYYCNNWEEFCELFITSFGIPNEQEDAYNQLQEFCQEDLDISIYFAEFNHLKTLAKYLRTRLSMSYIEESTWISSGLSVQWCHIRLPLTSGLLQLKHGISNYRKLGSSITSTELQKRNSP